MGGELCRIGKHNYSSKTAHHTFYKYREKSPLWVLQGKGGFKDKDGKISYSHRFIGKHDSDSRAELRNRVINDDEVKNLAAGGPPDLKPLSQERGAVRKKIPISSLDEEKNDDVQPREIEFEDWESLFKLYSRT